MKYNVGTLGTCKTSVANNTSLSSISLFHLPDSFSNFPTSQTTIKIPSPLRPRPLAPSSIPLPRTQQYPSTLHPPLPFPSARQKPPRLFLGSVTKRSSRERESKTKVSTDISNGPRKKSPTSPAMIDCFDFNVISSLQTSSAQFPFAEY